MYFLIPMVHLDLILLHHQKIVLRVVYRHLIPKLLLEKIYHHHLKRIVELLVLDHNLQPYLHYKHHRRHLM